MSTLFRFFYLVMTTMSPPGNHANNSSRAVLRQGMLGQTTPGAIILQRRQFGSEIIRVHRMTVK